MGKQLDTHTFTRQDRARYREKVRSCLDVFALMLNDFAFDSDKPLTGLEVEISLVDDDANPAMCNADVLARVDDPMLQAELGRFNLEMNVPPRLLAGDGFDDYRRDISGRLARAERSASGIGAHLCLVGTLPTLREEHTGTETLSGGERYHQLNQQIIQARGEDLSIDIRGMERLSTMTDSIVLEAACTSLQFHLQVSPDAFADTWNAAQAIAGVQCALGANSPYLFGRELWAETRIALFEQATDTRPAELKAQGVRPRVWFGERWITSIFDLFEENVRYFPPLLPILDDEDPKQVLAEGGVPKLGELRLHNGTVYRWNRPVYDIMNDRPHLRVENRVLPAGPTVADMVANAAFFYGVVRQLCEQDRPIWTQMTFSSAEENFHTAARDGIESRLLWPALGEVPATELVLEHLLPLAYQGLDEFGVDAAVRDRLLGIIEGRCRTGLNGAQWQVETVAKLEDDRQLDRHQALAAMLQRYCEHMRDGNPVHTWPIG
ncbi:glutamate-cysteine ligase family protein [Actinocatenispora comari]|jgi:gamma-glutamyl:cysteine ligase YbdK (ATP-grasp superfamily)|uniref:Glutamate--cysteine ligase n=1 Tax=Actinocatenispora comari TaxID=2807577 RepID=A0A8J4A6Y9_9ACTN|nr:glutamate-cysteine ligase family protein [Actinocatenispora comari]GIL24814.1 glutamate--cysteine ligase [Actinocatenispora comari]